MNIVSSVVSIASNVCISIIIIIKKDFAKKKQKKNKKQKKKKEMARDGTLSAALAALSCRYSTSNYWTTSRN